MVCVKKLFLLGPKLGMPQDSQRKASVIARQLFNTKPMCDVCQTTPLEPAQNRPDGFGYFSIFEMMYCPKCRMYSISAENHEEET